MRARENVQDKGRQLLVEGRVAVDLAEPGRFAATVRASGGYHAVTFGRGGWSCTCQAGALCSHLVAAQLISGGWSCTCRSGALCSHLVAAQLTSAPGSRADSLRGAS